MVDFVVAEPGEAAFVGGGHLPALQCGGLQGDLQGPEDQAADVEKRQTASYCWPSSLERSVMPGLSRTIAGMPGPGELDHGSVPADPICAAAMPIPLAKRRGGLARSAQSWRKLLDDLLSRLTLGRQVEEPGGSARTGAPHYTTTRSRICSLGRTWIS
ncbi:hypothetical protein [Streptomyces sp. NPDC048508]|uniref:hypothetical protein n=1 Tax=Streptomyces sp. NPDC048508 TaxID=3365561 RepID=UPI003724159C